MEIRNDDFVSDLLQKIQQRDAARESKRKLFLQMLSDPDLADIVSELVRRSDAQRDLPLASDQPKSKPPSFRQMIRDLIPVLPMPFTILDVVTLLESRWPEFGEAQHKLTYKKVTDALYRLVERKEGFRLVEKGKGGSQNFYEYRTGDRELQAEPQGQH